MRRSLATGLALYASLVACGAPSPKAPPAYCADQALFTATLLRCVDKSSTREQSRACRRDVHASCGFVETLSVTAHE